MLGLGAVVTVGRGLAMGLVRGRRILQRLLLLAAVRSMHVGVVGAAVAAPVALCSAVVVACLGVVARLGRLDGGGREAGVGRVIHLDEGV